MKKTILGFLLAVLTAPAALAALKEGDAAPDFKTQASLAGKAFDFSLKEALTKGTVVVYFYPSAYTKGCNIQAREFARQMDQFAAAGASVIGVSLDSIERLNDFSADPDYCAGKLPVASDPEGRIAKSYDLSVKDAGSMVIKDTRGSDIKHGFTERTTFVISPDGKVGAVVGGVAPADNVAKTLDAVQKLKAATR